MAGPTGASNQVDRARAGLLLLSLAALLGLVGCGPVAGLFEPDGVEPLAKAEGWRDGLEPMLPPFGILEVVYDRPTAERAWSENVPVGLVRRDGDPAEPGIYGELDDVDFDRQVVLVWSSGESSSCPGWLGDVDVDDAGTVHLQRDDTAGAFGDCTADYRPYRLIGVVDRGSVPDAGALPTEDVTGVPEGPGAIVTAYPADR